MQHVPESVIQAPESPDAEALPVSFHLMMTCAVYRRFTVPEKSVCAD